MLGNYPNNVPGVDPTAATRKEWGFTTSEFNEIMKHIQVLGPAIQKVCPFSQSRLLVRVVITASFRNLPENRPVISF